MNVPHVLRRRATLAKSNLTSPRRPSALASASTCRLQRVLHCRVRCHPARTGKALICSVSDTFDTIITTWENCVLALVQYFNYDFASIFSTLCFRPCYFELNCPFAPALDVRQMPIE